MSLRGQVPDAEATYEDPILGVNLHSSGEDLKRGETDLMQNMVYFGGTVSRTGTTALTGSLGSSLGITGGHKFYYGTASKKRLVTYGTTLSSIADNGTETVIFSLMTTSLPTIFTTWPITDSVYIANNNDPLRVYDGTTIKILGAIVDPGASYIWTASGSGTNEYYITLAGGSNPNITDPSTPGGVYINQVFAAEGVVSSLAAGEWGYGNGDSLGFSTVYVRLSDGTDPDTKAEGYVQIMQGTAVPGVSAFAPTIQVIGVVDRLFAITSNGIERTDPRDPTIWSNDSSWATFRPSQSGIFKAHVPHAVVGDTGVPSNGALAMTDNSYYFYTGTDFGEDVTSATPSAGEDGAIYFIDNVGAFGPKSVVSVPGIGTFWLTTNKNIYFVPTGRTGGKVIGTRIINVGGGSTVGLESLNISEADKAWLVYFEPYLMLGFAVNSETHPTTQYWLDMDRFRMNADVPIWYGPMKGQTIETVWVEGQQGDNALKGGEGNTTTGAYVYNMRVADTYSDTVGAATNSLAMQLSTYLKSGGAPSREKYIQGVEIEMNSITGSATCDVADITGTILSGLPIEKTFLE